MPTLNCITNNALTTIIENTNLKKMTFVFITLMVSITTTILPHQVNIQVKDQLKDAQPQLASPVINFSHYMITQPTSIKTLDSKQHFIQSLKKRFSHVTRNNLTEIWTQAKVNGINPEFSAAIAWKETNFNNYETSNVGAHGEYQIMDATASAMGVSNPQVALGNPITSVKVGNKYLRILFNMFDGHGIHGYKEFKSIKINNVDAVMFNGYLLRDQNGQVIPLTVFVAMAYNGGPTVIYNAAKLAMTYKQPIIIDPRSPYTPFSFQQLDYIRKIAANGLYNFQGYHFSYTVDDVPQDQLA